MSAWHDARTIARRHGLAAATLWLGHGAATRVLGLAWNRVLWLDAERVNTGVDLPSGITCRLLTATEVAQLASAPVNTLHTEDGRRISELGHHCFAAFQGDRLVAYCWYGLGRIAARDHWGLSLTLPAGVALSYNAFTYPGLRGQRLHGGLKLRALEVLKPRGVRALVSLVRIANWQSIRSLERAGFRDLGLLCTLGSETKRVLGVPRRATQLGIRFGVDS
jgi:hypothetical protein